MMYGAAEFSRDTDLALLASDENLALLKTALRELMAKRIALPPFDREYLIRGHAVPLSELPSGRYAHADRYNVDDAWCGSV